MDSFQIKREMLQEQAFFENERANMTEKEVESWRQLLSRKPPTSTMIVQEMNEKSKTAQQLKNEIFYEFCLLTRACCYRKQGNTEEITLCGKVADYLHNIATCELESPFGQAEIRNYKRFLDDYFEEPKTNRTAIYFYLLKQRELVKRLDKCYV